MEILKESFLYFEDALARAEEVADKLDGIVMRQSVASVIMPRPNDVEKWENTIDAFYVYGDNKDVMGIFAYIQRKKPLDYSLPEFAFLDDYNGDESLLDKRVLILHLKTGMLIEIVYHGDSKIDGDIYSYHFSYTDFYGGEARFLAYLHPAFYLELEQLNSEEVMEVLHSAAAWFITYCKAEDDELQEIAL